MDLVYWLGLLATLGGALSIGASIMDRWDPDTSDAFVVLGITLLIIAGLLYFGFSSYVMGAY